MTSYENAENIRRRIFALIDAEYESDAAFERALGLPEKTVSNWRRGRSNSFMKMLPALSEAFHVNVGDLLDLPIRTDTSELSEEEIHLLHLYRKSRTLPRALRAALAETLESVIRLYIGTPSAIRNEKNSKKENKN